MKNKCLGSHQKKIEKWRRWAIFYFILFFWNWKINLGSHQKKIEKWQGRPKIPYHQKNACISRVSKTEYLTRSLFLFFLFLFLVVKIRWGSWWERRLFLWPKQWIALTLLPQALSYYISSHLFSVCPRPCEWWLNLLCIWWKWSHPSRLKRCWID